MASRKLDVGCSRLCYSCHICVVFAVERQGHGLGPKLCDLAFCLGLLPLGAGETVAKVAPSKCAKWLFLWFLMFHKRWSWVQTDIEEGKLQPLQQGSYFLSTRATGCREGLSRHENGRPSAARLSCRCRTSRQLRYPEKGHGLCVGNHLSGWWTPFHAHSYLSNGRCLYHLL